MSSPRIKFVKNRKIWALYTILIIIVIVISTFFVSDQYISSQIAKEETILNGILVGYSNDISHMIGHSAMQLTSLKEFILHNHTTSYLEANFTNYAKALYLSLSGIRNYIIAPNGVNKYVYPLEGNEAAVGHVIINDSRPEVRDDITRALQTQNIIISLPYELRQGGLGLVFRQAIFIDNEFWGIVSMVIDLPIIFDLVNLVTEYDEYLFALKDYQGNVFFGDPDIFDDDSVEMKIELPEFYWSIGGLPKTSWFDLILTDSLFTLILIIISGLSIGILVYLLTGRIYIMKLQSSVYLEKFILSEDKLRNFIEHASDAIAFSEFSGKYIMANKKAIEMIGYSEEELFNMRPFDLIPVSNKSDLKAIREGLLKDSNLLYETKITRKDGTILTVELSLNLSRDNLVQLIIRDISEQKEQLSNLERLVDERTAELVLANKDLEDFASSASHDLRAPLRALIGISDILSDEYPDKLDDTGKDYLSRMNIAAIKMDKIIIDLLSYSKLSQEEISLTPVNIENIVDEVLSNYQDQITENKAIIEVTRPLDRVLGTYPILNQVIDNLISNAFKYSIPERIMEIRIWSERINGNIRLCIQDNGIGIDDADMENIFEPFKRLHSDEFIGGTGIGLAIVQRGIIKLGGKVGVESSIGEFSRFWIELKEGS